MDYKLANGSIVNDNMLEEMAGEWESGEWDGHLSNVTLAVPDREEPTKVVTFRISESRAAAVKAATKKAGITQSEFYRRAVDRELAAFA